MDMEESGGLGDGPFVLWILDILRPWLTTIKYNSYK